MSTRVQYCDRSLFLQSIVIFYRCCIKLFIVMNMFTGISEKRHNMMMNSHKLNTQYYKNSHTETLNNRKFIPMNLQRILSSIY